MEYELLDTGIFDEDRYFDIFVEYGKATPEEVCVRIEAFNRGPEPAPLHLLPHLWFRNTWAWKREPHPEPAIGRGPGGPDFITLVTEDSAVNALDNLPVHYHLGLRTLYAPAGGVPLFTNNETNPRRVYVPGLPRHSRFVKDAFHRHLIGGEACINPAQRGTKAALHYHFPAVPAGGSVVLRLRLSDNGELKAPLADVDALFDQQRAEADAFYEGIQPPGPVPTRKTSSDRRSPASSGPNRATSSTSMSGSTAIGPTCRRPQRG